MERDSFLGPGAFEDRQNLRETFAAFGVGDALGLVGAGETAAADAENQAAVADVIDGGGFLRDAQRVAQRQDLDRELTVEVDIEREVTNARPAAPELAHEFEIRSESLGMAAQF